MALSRIRLGFSSAVLAVVTLLAGAASAQVEVVPATTLPTELPPDTYPDSRQLAVAAGADGRAIAVWGEVDYSAPSSNRRRTVSSRVFDPLGATFEPVLRQTSKGAEPRVGVSASYSRYLLPWASGPDSSNRQLVGRILDADGVPLTSATSLADEFQKSFGVWTVGADGGDAGHVVAWGNRNGQVRAKRVGNDGSSGIEVEVDRPFVTVRVDPAITPDGGFVVAYGSLVDTIKLRGFTATGLPKGDAVALTNLTSDNLLGVAASPVSDVVAVLFLRDDETPALNPVLVERFTSAGVAIGAPITVAMSGASSIGGDLAYDRNGDLYVVWADPGSPMNVHAFYPDGTPVGPPVSGSTPVGGEIRTTRLANGDFLNLASAASSLFTYNVVSLCVPGSSVCGDGALDPLCEACDAGAANSDVTPDTCRTDCEPARCGDGTIDGGETCDDGNTIDCDDCSAACLVEAGLGCGDGIAFPSCGEACDDGNPIVGDGCNACALERAPGGGSPTNDCFTAWSIDNSSNTPRYDKTGAISATQLCTDGDSACDFDGGTPGGCTFHVRVCANNTDLAACTPGSRIRTWELRTPSASRAAANPALAAVRDAFMSVVPGGVVGPSQPDVCSAVVAVPVPLRDSPGGYAKNKVAIKTRATLYDGRNDSDKLRLECRPAP